LATPEPEGRQYRISNKPVKCPVCQSDEGSFLTCEKSVHASKKYGFNELFSPLGRFMRILTLQFSGLTTAPCFGWGGSTVKREKGLFWGPEQNIHTSDISVNFTIHEQNGCDP
jgi:hypothetical protein